MLSLRKRIASAAVAVTTAIVLVPVGTTPASAGTVTVRWGCANPWGNFGQRDFHITLTAPATATRGQTATVTASIVETTNTFMHYAAGANTGQFEIMVGGAGSGLIYANGLTNPEIQPGTPWRLDGGRVDYTFANAGDVTFKPRVIRVYASGVAQFLCGSESTPIAATTHVT